MKTLMLGLLLISSIHNAYAEPSYSATYTQCVDKAAGVTADMIGCVDTEMVQWDKKLNTHYQALKAGLTPVRQKQLQEVQKIWLKFRDSNCAFYADPEGGSLQRVLANNCMLRLTAERAEELAGLKDL